VLQLKAVPRSIHVRLDEPSAVALGLLRAGGLSDSEAVRVALREAADRRRARSALVAEARALAADREDLAEAREVRELMTELAPETVD
jgi:Arc/MetJ-type ribon-helix-helix transcriptional regulator